MFKKLSILGFVLALFLSYTNANARIINYEYNPETGNLFSAGEYLDHLKNNYNVVCDIKPGIHCVNFAEPKILAKIALRKDLHNIKTIYRQMVQGKLIKVYEPELDEVVTVDAPNGSTQVRELIYVINRALGGIESEEN